MQAFYGSIKDIFTYQRKPPQRRCVLAGIVQVEKRTQATYGDSHE